MDLTREQRMTVLAAFLGWMLDAFDFFLLTFLLKDIAKEFGVEVPAVAYALFLTLAMRFVGAFIFGRIGDRWGRKPALMLDILCYSILGALAAFSPNLTIFLILRALFGIAMGGEWGLGSSLAMESIPPQARGWCLAFCNAATRPASCSLRSPMACSTAERSATITIGLAGHVPAQCFARFLVLFIRQRRFPNPRLRGVEGACEAPSMGDDSRRTGDWCSTWSC